MRIERFKGIANYISEKVGFEVREPQCRKWAKAGRADPLPLRCFAGSVGADSDELDAWIKRNEGVRQQRKKLDKSAQLTESADKTQLRML